MKNNVRSQRLAKGWSQATLGERCGVSRQTIISIENCKLNPSLPLAFMLAKVLDTSVEELFLPS
ncbi:helix-turn-helix transcriptional regulator [Lysinibacter sp. HNR]|nr:helix-turn-helix transcriptional regulator [Lysinibacter sp. HNR]WGD37430.1 helix-turn-helix transcriptional regulator [Lysinibacter sp. HNR]